MCVDRERQANQAEEVAESDRLKDDDGDASTSPERFGNVVFRHLRAPRGTTTRLANSFLRAKTL